MKKIFYLITFCLIAGYIYPQATYDSVAAFTEKTTIAATDLLLMQTKVSNKYTWRKMTGLSFWGQVRDTTESYHYAAYDAANTFTDLQTFNSGATFASGSAGAVTFADSLVTSGIVYYQFLFPYAGSKQIGTVAVPNNRIYSQNFVLVNSGGTDTAQVSFDGTSVSFSGAKLTADTLEGISNLTFPQIEYQVLNVADTTVTLPYGNVVYFVTPGADIPKIETITMSGIPTGSAHMLILKIQDAGAPYNTVTLRDVQTSGSLDGNLYLNGDFELTIHSLIVLLYDEPSGIWLELARSVDELLGNQYGTYTPTITGGTNVAASSAYECQYMRVGNIVTVSGKIGVDPTAGSTSTDLRLSLPISSNLAKTEQLSGTASGIATAGEVAGIYADNTNDEAKFEWVTSNASLHIMYFNFTYQIK